jgi:S-adenosylmethionine:tRNA-ribosyltransferase-isomerase (queuine synthetase)
MDQIRAALIESGMSQEELDQIDDETLEAAEEAKSAGISIMCIGTDDADTRFLERLATRKELSAKVESAYLRQGIAKMAGLLPDKSREPRLIRG